MADLDVEPEAGLDLDELPACTNGLKRRQSDASEQEQESKRRRVSLGKSSPTAVKTEEVHVKLERDSPKKQDSPTQAKANDSKPEPAQQPHTESTGPRRASKVTDEKQRSKR
ncbi:hypothetical protein LTR53_018868, partial [Teratosphaeriaceae sp. CCFEE 6253]